MALQVLSLIASFIAALAALLSIPSIHSFALQHLPSRWRDSLSWMRRLLITLAVISPGVVVVWFHFFYPCSWYEINNLRSEVSRLNSLDQYSATSEIGEKLCDCGDLAYGWNVQGNAAYDAGQYHTAVNFYKRALKADPENGDGRRRNLASAYIYTGDYQQAINLYREIKSRTDSETNRYSLGRALVFAGKFEEASEELRGLDVVDGGSKGQSSVFYALAQLGIAQREADERKKENLIKDASGKICGAISVERLWKDWLFNKNSTVGKLDAVRYLLNDLPAKDC